MKTLPFFLFLLLALPSFAQENLSKGNSSLLLYPEVYFVATMETSASEVSSNLLAFIEENNLSYRREGNELVFFRVFPSIQSAENASKIIKTSIQNFLKDESKPLKYRLYGREYLPEKFLKYFLEFK
jgi:hypothetical protein